MMVTRLPWMAQRLVSKKSAAAPVDGLYTFEQRDKVSLNSLLEGTDGRRLESEIGLEVLGDFSDETLEGQLADQELSRLLVTTDFTKSDCTGAVTMGLLDTSGTTDMSDEWPSLSGDSYVGADFLAALEASCLRGALPPVDLRAVCLVRAI
jgi:hypothetical protein